MENHMTVDISGEPFDPSGILTDSDVRNIVKLLGDTIVSRQDFASVKRLLVEGICRLIDADAWAWSLGCHTQPGEQPVYLGMAHGGFDGQRYAHLALAAGHPDMAWTSEKILAEMRDTASHITRLRQQIVDESTFAASGVNDYLCKADIGPFIFSLRPIDGQSVSTVCFYRRHHARPFSERESRIAHILLSELPWLHEAGWPTDRGASVPRLTLRLRLVLNLLLDGRTRKEIAAHLSLSPYTVAQYQKVIYRHFGVNSHMTLLKQFQMEQARAGTAVGGAGTLD